MALRHWAEAWRWSHVRPKRIPHYRARAVRGRRDPRRVRRRRRPAAGRRVRRRARVGGVAGARGRATGGRGLTALSEHHLFRYESKRQPLLSRAAFARRLARNFAAASLLVGASLLAGMAGYH